MKKRFLALFIIAVYGVMVFPLFASGKSDAKKLFDAQIITSQQVSLPLKDGISRGEFVGILNKIFGIYTTTGDKFTDSTANSLYYYDLMAAKTSGYLTAYEDGTARGDEFLIRSDAALMFDRLLDLPQPKIELQFKDDDMPSESLSSVQGVVAEDIMQARDGFFLGADILTRGEAYASFISIVERGLHAINSYELMNIASFDGYNLAGRLSVPTGQKKIEKLVIFVDGSGPNTYQIKREAGDFRFKYVDFFAQEAAKRGVAYFSYNTRGVHMSDENPFYTINDAEYKTYTPTNVAKDLVVMVDALRQDSRLQGAEIYLLGWSEGATVAPLAVTEYNLEVDALLLAGYPNENIREILDWQLGGDMYFFIYGLYFNSAIEGFITKEEYEADPHGALQTVFGGATFEDTDTDGDGFISVNDFKVQNQTFFAALLDAVANNDYLWISENYPVRLTPEWFHDHFSLGKTENILANVDIPIYIFHGELDLSTPVSGAYDAEKRFSMLNKANLHLNVYDAHDHDLNFLQWLYTGTMSEGIQGIFDTLDNL